MKTRPNPKINHKVHPYIFAYLKKGVPSMQMRWYMKYFKWIKIAESPDFQLNEYKFYDGNNDQIRL